VMPEFVSDETEHQAWKQRVLNGSIVLEELDTTPYKERAGVGKGVAISKLATTGVEAQAAA